MTAPIPVLDRELLPPNAGLAALVDVETTGLSPNADSIVEFGGVLFAFDRVSGNILGSVYGYGSLNNPGFPIPANAKKVHGITDRMVQGQHLDPSVVDSLLRDAEFIVAHNARFDYGFVSKIGKIAGSKPWVCSMRGIDWASAGCQSSALQILLAHHGIRPRAAHRAMNDVMCTLTLLASDSGDGRPYLAQLLDSPGKAKKGSSSLLSRKEKLKPTQDNDSVLNDVRRQLKASEDLTDPVGRHFLYLQIVEATYKLRDNQAYRTEFIEHATRHVSEFKILSKYLCAEFGETLPWVPTFQYLATAFTEEECFDKAIAVCNQALAFGLRDGTKSGFEGRKRRIKKKRAMSNKHPGLK